MASKLFNPNGDDSLENRTIIKGSTTRLFNLNKTKYPWSPMLYKVMVGNHWVPESISLRQDLLDYNKLSESERKTFKRIISFLTFLDSIQTNNIPNIKQQITASEVSTLLAIHEFQEAIHSQSYAYILEGVIPDYFDREKVYELWRDDEILFNRNKYIAEIYENYLHNNSDTNFFKVLVANYILEGLYFYNGFMFFYNLSSRNLMPGVHDEIRYIHRDEKTHTQLFAFILQEIKKEFPKMFKEDIIYELFNEGVNQEINWTNYSLQDGIIGMDSKTTQLYTKYLANNCLSNIGLKPMFSNIENPYSTLEQQSDLSGNSLKSNFFEAKVVNYTNADAIKGWDDIDID